jgi:hypothetical protein
MKKLTTGFLGISLAIMTMASACGSDDSMSQGEPPAAAELEPAAVETEPEVSAAGNYSSLAGDRLTSGDLSLGLRAELRENDWTVDFVVPGSPAALAGIQVGDLMVSIDHLWVDGISEETEREFRDELSRGTVEVTIERGGQPLSFAIDTAPSPEVFPQYFPDAPGAVDKAITAGGACFTTCVGDFACVLPTSFGTSCFCIPCSVF